VTARRIRTEEDLLRLSPAEQEARVRAAEALQELRNHPGLTLEAAAHRHHTTPSTINAYFGHLLTRDRAGRYHPAKTDLEPFLMDVIGPDGPVERVVVGSRERQLNLEHHRALARYAGPDGGEASVLRQFRGRRVAGVELLTDPDMVERLFDAGEFEFLEYQSF
jgi:hypothetical protein